MDQRKGQEKTAAAFVDVIRTLAASPERLAELESYLSQHFDKWLRAYANTPEGLVYELRGFAEMEIDNI